MRFLLLGYIFLCIPAAQAINREQLNIMSFTPEHTREIPEHVSIRSIIEQISSKKVIPTTLSIKSKQFLIANRIPKLPNPDDTIFVYCHGWVGNFFGHPLRSKGLGTQIAYCYIKQNIMHGVVVTFDFPNDHPSRFNLAQENDMACIQLLIQEITNINPSARIVLVGDSRGAAAILNVMTHSAPDSIKNISGVIIECPPVSLARVAHDFVWNIPVLSAAAHAALGFFLPAYTSSEQIKTLFNGNPFRKDVPLFIGRVSCDWHTSAQGIQDIADHIKNSGHQHVYLYTHTPPIKERWLKCWHAQMAKIPGYQYGINAFCQRYDFPHDSVYAQKGRRLLDAAHQKASQN